MSHLHGSGHGRAGAAAWRETGRFSSHEQIKHEVTQSTSREPTTQETFVSDQLAGHVEGLHVGDFVEVIDELRR